MGRVDWDVADHRLPRRQRSRALSPFASRRIRNPTTADAGERRQPVAVRLTGRKDMDYAKAARDESIREEPAVAFPREGLRAHDRGPPS